VVWIKDQTNHNIPLKPNLAQALTLFDSLKAEGDEGTAEGKFKTSRGWFMRFKQRSHLHKVQNKTANDDLKAAAIYLEDLSKITDEGSCTKQWIFNVDKTSLYWKMVSSREKSMPGIKIIQKALLLGVTAAGDFKLKPMHIYRSKHSRLKTYAKSILTILYKWNNNTCRTAHLFTEYLTEYFKPTVEIYCSEKKPFKILLLIDKAPSCPRVLMEIHKEKSVFTCLLIQHPLIQHPNAYIISTFKSYYLRNIFCKAIATIEIPLDGSEKTSWKEFNILDAIKNNCVLLEEEVKVSTDLRIQWRKYLQPALMDDFERFKNSVEEVPAGVVETCGRNSKRTKFETEPEDVTELLQSHDHEELLLMNQQRKRFFEIASTAGEDAVEIPETTTKKLKQYINRIEKVAAGFEKVDSNIERSSPVGKTLSNNIPWYRGIVHERNSLVQRNRSLLLYFKKWPSPLEPSVTTIHVSKQPSTWR
uniref:HTH CENPB-type domain-containing protein n=1 Tax=Chlorocebus sabaeus TaxID=60711 RepID=A0A0D9RQC1_CHLSB